MSEVVNKLMEIRNIKAKDAALILGVSLRSVYNLMDRGTLKSVNPIGTTRRIPLDSLQAYMAQIRGELE